MFLYCGERLALAKGFHSAASEHSLEGCVSQDGCILCSRGAAGCPGLSYRAQSLWTVLPGRCVGSWGRRRLHGVLLATAVQMGDVKLHFSN